MGCFKVNWGNTCKKKNNETYEKLVPQPEDLGKNGNTWRLDYLTNLGSIAVEKRIRHIWDWSNHQCSIWSHWYAQLASTHVEITWNIRATPKTRKEPRTTTVVFIWDLPIGFLWRNWNFIAGRDPRDLDSITANEGNLSLSLSISHWFQCSWLMYNETTHFGKNTNPRSLLFRILPDYLSNDCVIHQPLPFEHPYIWSKNVQNMWKSMGFPETIDISGGRSVCRFWMPVETPNKQNSKINVQLEIVKNWTCSIL